MAERLGQEKEKEKEKEKEREFRVMLPMSIGCKACGDNVYKGTKLNSRKEDVMGDGSTYLGIQKVRFYFNCNNCSAVLAIRTDPQTSGYVVDSGATPL